MRRTYKYRAYINAETEANAKRWLWKCWHLYNIALANRIYMYKHYEESRSNYDQYDLVKRKPIFDGLSWLELSEVNIHVLEDVLKRLHLAYQAFFRRVKAGEEESGFPRYARHYKYNSFTFRLSGGKPSGWRIEGNRLVTRLGEFKLKLHRPYGGRIKTVTIILDVDEWYVCFSCDDVPAEPMAKTGKQVALCMFRPWFGEDSDGRKIREPAFYRKRQKGLARCQRRRQRRKKGSNRYKEARMLEAKFHRVAARQRKDFIDNEIKYYVTNYDVIVVNKLQIANEVKKPEGTKEERKAKLDNGWGIFIERLKNKAAACGRTVVEVEKFDEKNIERNQMNPKNLMASAGPAVAKAVGSTV